MKPLAKRASVPLAFLVLLGAPIAAWSQSDAPAVKASAVGDIMGQTQLRHFKLGYAGELGNWPLASYEVQQIRRSFGEAGRIGEPVGGEPFAKLLDEKSLPPLGEVEQAIAAKSEKDFIKAFDKLTQACNSCHVAANVGFIKIKVPTASPFSNQAFPP